MQVNVVGAKSSVLELPDDVFACEYNEPLIHQVVTAFYSAARAGTSAQKSRADVSGGGIKPWRQKGSGRARAGSSRSPLWRKGGVTFAASPRDYSQKVNRKMYRGAIKSILSELFRSDRLLVVDTFDLATPKTKDLLSKLNEMSLSGDILIVADVLTEALILASRNVYRIGVTDVPGVNPAVLLGFNKIIMTVDALKHLEESLS